MENVLADAWGAQAAAAVVGFLALIGLMVKSGKISVTLFAPSQEKAAMNTAEILLGAMSESFKENLVEFRKANVGLAKIHTTLTEIRDASQKTRDDTHELLSVQRALQIEVAKQSGFMEGARK